MEQKNRRQIVFFSAFPEAMNYKIAKEFKSRGYETILFTISQKDQWDESEFVSAYDKIICTDFLFRKKNLKRPFHTLKKIPSLTKFYKEAKKLKPYAVIGTSYTNWSISWAIKLFKDSPFIYFPYDIIALRFPKLETALEKKYKFELKSEKYNFEKADGILTKGPLSALDLLNKTYLGNVTLPPKKIEFLPYCSDEFIVPINKEKLSKKDGELHIAAAGGITFHKDSAEFFTTLFQKIISQKIHIHMYIKSNNLTKKEEENFNNNFKTLMESKYFHIEKPLPPKVLTKELSKYDFGFWPDYFRLDKDRIEYKYALGNRMSTFLEAGLPFFYNPDLGFVHELLKKYGLNTNQIDMNDLNNNDNLNEKINSLDRVKLERKVLRARSDFNFKNHFARLEKFVESVVNSKSQKLSHASVNPSQGSN
jgi:hypothetical protein